MNNTPQTLDQHYDEALLRLDPEHIILMAEQKPIRFLEFQSSVRRLVEALRLAGVTPGSLVGYSLANSLEAFTLPLAISRLGAACLPLYPLLPDELRCTTFSQGGAKFVVVSRESAPSLRNLSDSQKTGMVILSLEDLLQANDSALPVSLSSPDQPFLLTTSSGTTGKPKLVFLSQLNVATALSAAAHLSSFGPWSQCPDYRSMIAFPQSTSGIMILLGTAFLGVCQAFTSSLSPSHFLEIAHSVDADVISAPPAWLEALLAVPPSAPNLVPNLRGIAVGMDFLAPSLLQRLGERFPRLEAITNGYGLVETATVIMVWKGTGRDSFLGPTGMLSLCPGLGNQLKVCREDGTSVQQGEDGELWVRGPSVITSYLGRSEGFREGWFLTGDVVTRIDDHTVHLKGRQKYLIKRGGKSVSPLVVQEAIDLSPGVQRSAVVGIPHPLYGEMVWAFVVSNSDSQPNTASIMKTVRDRLPTHMVPDRIEFVTTLPLGRGVGKIDREALITQGKALLQALGV